jgi:hypothetical protein
VGIDFAFGLALGDASLRVKPNDNVTERESLGQVIMLLGRSFR